MTFKEYNILLVHGEIDFSFNYLHGSVAFFKIGRKRIDLFEIRLLYIADDG